MSRPLLLVTVFATVLLIVIFTVSAKMSPYIFSSALTRQVFCGGLGKARSHRLYKGAVLLAMTTTTSARSPAPCARVIPVPILSDNYAYLLVDPRTKKTACVDPAEPAKLLEAAKKENLDITTLLCTHKHWDHSGGNEEMARQVPSLQVVTTAYEDIPAATHPLKDNEVYHLGSLEIRALYTPCHTRGHVLFLVTSPEDPDQAPILFSGDTLFVGGCGRFFEGDGRQMVEALLGRVAKLPQETLVYCGHEYTLSNLAFAKSIEPDNKALLDKITWAKSQLAANQYTIPSTVGDELTYNPFMRVNVPEVAKKAVGEARSNDMAAVMSALREMKNNFAG